MIKEAEALVEALKKKSLKICTAESCTGGLISGAITEVAGASAVFDGGVCTYANRIKTALVDVPEKTLDTVRSLPPPPPLWRRVQGRCLKQISPSPLRA